MSLLGDGSRLTVQWEGSVGQMSLGFALLIERAGLRVISQVVLSSYISASLLTNIYPQLRSYQH